MVNMVGVWWEWVKGEIVPILTILAFVIAFLVYMRGRWSLVRKLGGRFTDFGKWLANLMTMRRASLVLVVFGILIWILGREVSLLIIHWLGLLFVFFAVLIWILDRKVYYVKKDLRTLYDRLPRLESRVAVSFEDDFKEGLHKNWHYYGQWELVPGGGLSVTQSKKGGITRVGHSWMDYSFEFTGIIFNRCIAWIVRAQDLSNYYMIQLSPTQVRPHLRFQDRWVEARQKKHGQAIDEKDLNRLLQVDKLLKIRTEVRGWEIRVYVNTKEIYHKQDFFSMRFVDQQFVLVEGGPGALMVPPFITGRVGFRMTGSEHGKLFRCRVRPL